MTAADTFSPEVKLLLLAARRVTTPADLTTITQLLASNLDWRALLMMASRHRVLALFYATLHREQLLGQLPPDVRDALQERVRAEAGRSLALSGELVRILRAFQLADIPAIPCKGPVVALTAYGDISYRSFCDLDVLVPESHVYLAQESLAALGYRCRLRLTPSEEIAYYENECALPFQNDRGHIVELHWRLFERNASVHLPMPEFWQRVSRISLLGMNVASLSREDLLLYLCVHGAKHLWERLEWIACVAEIARGHSSLDWLSTYERARKYRVVRLLNLGLSLSCSLLGLELPSPVTTRLAADPAARLLAARVQRDLFAPASVESHYQHRAARYLFMMRSRESWADRARILFYSAIRPPHPNAHEWVHLPPRLAFLHHVFRPVRLLGTYSLVAWRHYLR